MNDFFLVRSTKTGKFLSNYNYLMKKKSKLTNRSHWSSNIKNADKFSTYEYALFAIKGNSSTSRSHIVLFTDNKLFNLLPAKKVFVCNV